MLDDLHWADAPSLVLLQFLGREVAAGHILVLGTYRDGEVNAGHPLAGTLVALRRQPAVEWLSLSGLSAPEVALLIGMPRSQLRQNRA